ncbi:protein FAM200A-like [Hydra vulgaris]|uniref:Protein FAM200A-like n=1 Tax=Hydra vulgaris TaxID=6087 RepID=A0ABM4B2G9_HYDVU
MFTNEGSIRQKNIIERKQVLERIVIKEKKKNNETSAGTKGRGSFISLISKSTINQVILASGKLIQDSILLDMQEAGIFSLQIDTTQDITQKDQCSIVVRYVKGNIYDRVVAVLNCKSSTGKDMCNLISTFIKNNGLHIKNCIRNSTNGAANMRGQYNGFTSWLSKESPGQIHVWC